MADGMAREVALPSRAGGCCAELEGRLARRRIEARAGTEESGEVIAGLRSAPGPGTIELFARTASAATQEDIMTTPPSWDTVYAPSAAPPPWDIGRPQQAFVRLADRGLLSGRLLDAGCGTGEHTLLAAGRGAQATGVDISPHAIAKARDKAAGRGLPARFEVADVLSLGQLGMTFDTVIDSGVFHVFDDQDRARYVTSLASVLRPGGHCYLICFSDRQPGDYGPRRVRQDELRAAFSDGWAVTGIEAETFEVNPGMPTPAVQAWLAAVRRT